MGVIIGPRVIHAGASLLSVLIAPVPVAAGFPSPAQDYFLNSIGTANDQRIRHSVFEIDFEFDVPETPT